MIGVGQRIGNYRVLRKLGQGGMGAVYEAVQEQIGRRAAIKVLHPEYADDKASIRRFFDEARAVNIIQHPGLVGVFESGRLEDGGAYIVMEYLDGELLTSRLEKAGQLGHRDVLGFGRQIASALTAAHQKGIVHRDLKPDNIMIVADPETVDGERVKVFDFGIAKLRLNSLSPSLAPKELRTQTGMIMGTPSHMAPEQCRGAADVTGKADVYSLGVIIYQMLVGHLPFMAESPGELVSMHLRDKPPSLRKLDPSIPEDLADLVHSMLAKEPEARPEMAYVVEALEGLGAYRTRRISTVKTVASRSSGGSSRDGVKPRPIGGTLQQATGQTLSGASGKRFAVAIAAAGLLVMVSGFILFESEIATFLRGPQPPSVASEVTWILGSDPEGAQVINADTGQVLGQTPWQRREVRREGSLRLTLQAPGYRDSGTVILKYAESSNQKVSLERMAALPPDMATSATENQPFKLPEPLPGAKMMQWQVVSRPKGAEVIRAEDNFSYGRTPLTLPFEQRNYILKLILRLDGYQESPLLLDLSFDNKKSSKLTIKQSINLQRDRIVKPKEKDPASHEEPAVEPAKQPAREAPKDAPKDAPKETPKETPKDAPKETPLKEALKPSSDVAPPK